MKKSILLLGIIVTAALALIFTMRAARATAQSAIVESPGADQNVHVLGEFSSGRLGSATAVGDVNGDGYGDLIVSAPTATIQVAGATYTESGAVYLFLGSADLSGTWDLSTRAPNVIFYHQPDTFSGDWLGSDLAIGDLNDDSFDDIVIGTPGYLPAPAGAATVFLGRPSITAGTRISVNMALSATVSRPGFNVRLMGAYVDNYLGQAVAVGDVNGDGFDDLIAGAPGASPNVMTNTYYPDRRIYHYAAPVTRTQSGAVYVALGRSSWTSTTWENMDLQICLRELTVYGDDDYDAFGRSVASGDLNRDGYDDVIVGATGGDPGAPLTRTNAGEVYVFWGSSTITYADCSDPYTDTFVYDHQIITDLHYITRTAHVTLTGVLAGDGAGYDLSAADVNQDGYDDVFVGAPGADPLARTSAGAAYVLYGRDSFSPTLTLANADLTLSGAAADDRLGRALAAADLNRDGYDDLLLGAPFADYAPTATDSGALYAICGGGNLSGALDLGNSAHYNARVQITYALAYLGSGVGGGDVNADGWSELLGGAPGYDPPGRPDAGAAYAIGPRLHVSPATALVQAWQPITYAAELRTLCDALDVTSSSSTTLSAAPGAGGGWSGDTFSATVPGTWAVTATHRGLTGSAWLTVEEGNATHVIVSPTAVVLDPAEVFTFAVQAYNAYGYQLTSPSVNWSVTQGGGAIHSSQGVFTATLADGVYADTVVALVDGVTGTATVTVNNLAPTALVANAPLTGGEGQAIQLDGTPSRDPNDDALTYAWDVTYIPPTFDVDLVGATTSHSWGENGVYTIALRVRDDDSAEHITVTQVTVYNMPPTANANGPYTTVVNMPITLTGSASDPGGNFDPLTYTWDLDDNGSFESPGQVVSFSHGAEGNYVVALRVRDDDGGQDTVTTTVTVQPSEPVAFEVNAPVQGWVGVPFSVTVRALDNQSQTLLYFDGYAELIADSGYITSTVRSREQAASTSLNGPAPIQFTAGIWRGQVTFVEAGERQITVIDPDGPATGQTIIDIYARLFLPLVIRNG
jgi:hypothetical protein